jgi:hypothetical protein
MVVDRRHSRNAFGGNPNCLPLSDRLRKTPEVYDAIAHRNIQFVNM